MKEKKDTKKEQKQENNLEEKWTLKDNVNEEDAKAQQALSRLSNRELRKIVKTQDGRYVCDKETGKPIKIGNFGEVQLQRLREKWEQQLNQSKHYYLHDSQGQLIIAENKAPIKRGGPGDRNTRFSKYLTRSKTSLLQAVERPAKKPLRTSDTLLPTQAVWCDLSQQPEILFRFVNSRILRCLLDAFLNSVHVPSSSEFEKTTLSLLAQSDEDSRAHDGTGLVSEGVGLMDLRSAIWTLKLPYLLVKQKSLNNSGRWSPSDFRKFVKDAQERSTYIVECISKYIPICSRWRHYFGVQAPNGLVRCSLETRSLNVEEHWERMQIGTICRVFEVKKVIEFE